MLPNPVHTVFPVGTIHVYKKDSVRIGARVWSQYSIFNLVQEMLRQRIRYVSIIRVSLKLCNVCMQ